MEKGLVHKSVLHGMLSPVGRMATSLADTAKYALLREALKRLPERKLFCPVPFKMIEVERGGNTNLCCWLPKSPGRLDGRGLMELWNSAEAREIRSSILDGTFRYCDLERCPYFVSGSLPLQKNVNDGPYAEIIRKGLTTLETARVFLATDPRCNLRCISCRNDFAQVDQDGQKDLRRMMDAVLADLNRITALGLSGSGDPFASPDTREFLFNHESARFPDLKLYLLTNGLLLDRDCWERMRSSRAAVASVQVSVDGASRETYERIRLGSCYDRLRENLTFLADLRSRGDIGEFIISFVVNAINYREMKEFATMGFELGCDQVAFSFMSNWLNLNDEEYLRLAVHLPQHREHIALKEVLGDPLFSDPRVFLHNLSGLRPGRIMGESLFV